MTNLKEFKNLAENIALNDFDTLDEEHIFSDDYLTKKQLFMQEINKTTQETHSMKNKKRFLITAACLLLAIPTTAFAAAKIYELIVQNQNYEVTVSLNSSAIPKKDTWYQLVINELPSQMEVVKNTNNMKYSVKGNQKKWGIII